MSVRKSQIGSSPYITEPPPRVPGKPWYTTPPVSLPHPPHLAFARQFRTELAAQAQLAKGRKREQVCALLVYVNEWLRVANQLANKAEMDQVGLGTTDGILVEVNKLVHRLTKELGWDQLTPWEQQVKKALERRALALKAERSGRSALPKEPQ